jgi:NADPH:quinone reductase
MKACWYECAGGAREVLEFGDMPIPEPGPGEVRVKIARSAVNPTDCKRRELGRELGQFPKIIPNNDGAGTIDAIGAGIRSNRIGERVWLFGAQAGRPFGTASEYCVVPAHFARHLGDGQSFEVGACLGVPAVTAHRGLFADGDIAGLTVLITGGSGRVGRYALQMAKHAGATVIATAGSAEKVEHLAELGADYAVNYREDDILACVMDATGGSGVDRMVDVKFGANAAAAPDLIKPNGILTSYSSDDMPSPAIPFLRFMYKNITIRPFSIFGMPASAKEAAFEYIETLLRADALQHLVDSKYCFEDMVSAHEAIESGQPYGACIVNL